MPNSPFIYGPNGALNLVPDALANNFVQGYTTTATAAGTTALTNASTYQQYFTGTTTQTITMPVTSTLVLGWQYLIVNLSTGSLTINSSGGNLIQTMTANTQLVLTAVSTSLTTAAAWNGTYQPTTLTAPVSPTVQKFLSGSGTYTTPSGVQYIRVQMVGAGAGGTGSGTSPGAATNGGNTTFGTSLLVANGGMIGGTGGGVGGTASLGSGPIGTAMTGGGGGSISAQAATNDVVGGSSGGNSAYGAGAAGSSFNAAGTAAPANSGAGGGGAGNNNVVAQTNGAGGGAGGFVDAIINSPLSSYSYSIGAAGTGGSAGTGGLAGGNGGSGYIEVTEYYSNISISPSTPVSAATYFGGPYSGAAATPTFKAFQPPTIQKFTSGSGTYTTPTSPAPIYIRVQMVGGGGGSWGSGTAPGTSPGAGGNTTFGTSLLVANGGAVGASITLGGVGGTASLGSGPIGVAISGGGAGSGGFQASASDQMAGGIGGSSAFGGGGMSGPGANSTGFPGTVGATNTGGGAGGAGGGTTAASSVGGGGGAGGFVDAVITAPASTYSYAVGAAGTGGGAGTNGSAGAAGGSGIIIVTEFYQ